MHFYIRCHRNLHNTDRPVLAQMCGHEFQRDASGNSVSQVNIFLLDSAGSDDSLWVTVMTEGLCGGLVSYNLASLCGLLKLSMMLWSFEPCPCCYNMESQKCREKGPLELPAPPSCGVQDHHQHKISLAMALSSQILKTTWHGDHSFSEWADPVPCDPLYKELFLMSNMNVLTCKLWPLLLILSAPTKKGSPPLSL